MDLTIIDWLVKNKEWVFSGIGVAALVGLPAMVRALRRPSKTANTALFARIERPPDNEAPDMSSTVVSKVERVSPITPEEIRSAIDAAPPLQREAVAERYKNLRIEWDTELVFAENKSGTVNLQLRVQDPAKVQGTFSAMCKVNLDDYRELAVLPVRARIRVNGLIDIVTPHWVSLADARLTFLPTKSDA